VDLQPRAGLHAAVGYVNGVCVGHQFREGNQSPGAGILEFAQSCERVAGREANLFPQRQCSLPSQGDQYYSQPGRSFSITADLERCREAGDQNLPEAAWATLPDARGVATDREIAETVHTMNGTQQAFRLIVLRWPNPQPNLFEAIGTAITPWPRTGRSRRGKWCGSTTSGARARTGIRTQGSFGWSRCPAGSWRPMPCILPLGY